MDRQVLARNLWPGGSGPGAAQAYAVLDGAADDGILRSIRLSRLPHDCLYAGPLSPELQPAAPYLVQLAPESRFFHALAETGWGRNWGIFAVAAPDVTLKALRRHLRSLLRVRHEDGRWLLFRFYDPRVVRVFAAHAEPEQAARLFGPIERLACEGGDGELLQFCAPGTASASAAQSPLVLDTALLHRFEHEARIDAIATHYRLHLSPSFGPMSRAEVSRLVAQARDHGLTDPHHVGLCALLLGALDRLGHPPRWSAAQAGERIVRALRGLPPDSPRRAVHAVIATAFDVLARVPSDRVRGTPP